MNLLESFKPITTLIFDIDGVLTDGSLLVFETGEQVRQMSVKWICAQLAVKKIQPGGYIGRKWCGCRDPFTKTRRYQRPAQRDRQSSGTGGLFAEEPVKLGTNFIHGRRYP